MSYSRSLVIDHAGTAEVIKQIAELDFTHIEGAHSSDSKLCKAPLNGTRDDAKTEFLNYWQWLLPHGVGLKEPLVSFLPSHPRDSVLIRSQTDANQNSWPHTICVKNGNGARWPATPSRHTLGEASHLQEGTGVAKCGKVEQ
jgi:hypothetical protein